MTPRPNLVLDAEEIDLAPDVNSIDPRVRIIDSVRNGGESENIVLRPTLPPFVRQSTLRTTHVAVLRPQEAVPSQQILKGRLSSSGSSESSTDSDSFGSSGGSNNFQFFTEKNSEKNENLLLEGPVPALSSLNKPLESSTLENVNRMRSSTEKQGERKKGRLKARPTPATSRPNFHPIPSGSVPASPVLPQARPNVPVSENEFQSLPGRVSQKPNPPGQKIDIEPKPDRNMSIISNDNNGVWFIEEKVNQGDNGPPFKREFSSDGPRPTTINPALTAVPRTLPPHFNRAVSVVEKSRNGEIETEPVKYFESTTFSTSRVEVRQSTTPSPFRAESRENRPTLGSPSEVLGGIQQRIQEKENIMVHNRGMSPNSLDLETASAQPDTQSVISKPSSVDLEDLESLSEVEDTDTLAALVRSRRRKLRQRAKALMSAIEADPAQPFVVLPMHQVSPQLSIDVDQMFDPQRHPGVKRISAYDFEEMLTKNASIAVSDNKFAGMAEPVDQLNRSIQGLASSMDLLSSSVKQTTAPSSSKTDENRETIEKLQEEIAKLTKTLEALKLVPGLRTTDDADYRDEDVEDEVDDYDTRTGFHGMDQAPAGSMMDETSGSVVPTEVLPSSPATDRSWVDPAPSTRRSHEPGRYNTGSNC